MFRWAGGEGLALGLALLRSDDGLCLSLRFFIQCLAASAAAPRRRCAISSWVGSSRRGLELKPKARDWSLGLLERLDGMAVGDLLEGDGCFGVERLRVGDAWRDR